VNHAVWDTEQWTVPDAISPTDASAKQVSIDIAPNGTIHLVWGQFQGGSTGVGFARFVDGVWSDAEFLTEGPATDPVLATDSAGNAIVAWSADDEIVVRRFDGSQWQLPETIGPGSWPTFASDDAVTIAWTRQADGGYEVVVTDLFDVETNWQVPLLVIIVATAIIVITAAVMLSRRRGSRASL
jgi:hypothetical protein